MFERIGKIKSTQLIRSAHGMPSFGLTFEFGVTRQTFGGYAWGEYNEKTSQMEGTAAGADLILGILNACGVDTWEDIAGTTMYALYDNDQRGQTIRGIKALPFEDGGTFLIKEWQKRWFPEEG